jgi:hypothetical protein
LKRLSHSGNVFWDTIAIREARKDDNQVAPLFAQLPNPMKVVQSQSQEQ